MHANIYFLWTASCPFNSVLLQSLNILPNVNISDAWLICKHINFRCFYICASCGPLFTKCNIQMHFLASGQNARLDAQHIVCSANGIFSNSKLVKYLPPKRLSSVFQCKQTMSPTHTTMSNHYYLFILIIKVI